MAELTQDAIKLEVDKALPVPGPSNVRDLPATVEASGTEGELDRDLDWGRDPYDFGMLDDVQLAFVFKYMAC